MSSTRFSLLKSTGEGSKRKRKTKSSEIFARELQSFANTLDNVKRLYADSKDRIEQDPAIKKLCYTEICDEASPPPVLSGMIYPHEDTLPLLMPCGVTSPALSTGTSENKLDSREGMDGAQEVTVLACVDGNHEAPLLSDVDGNHEAPLLCDADGNHEAPSLCVDGNHEAPLLCDIDGNHEAPSPCIEPPSETYSDMEAVEGRECLGHNTQQEHLCRLPCTEEAVAGVSNIFTFFLKRLIKFGVEIDVSQSPGYVKDLLVSHQVKDTKQNGAEELKEAEPKQHSETTSLFISKIQEDSEDRKEVEPEKNFMSSSLLLSQGQEAAKEPNKADPEMQLLRTSSLFNANEGASKESTQVDLEKNSSLLLTRHEDKAEELKETETKRQIEIPSVPFRTWEEFTSDSDKEDDDNLKHLWDDMEFSLACMNESKRSQVGPSNNKNNGCNHDFYKKDDLGLVCSLCGLVGQDTEHIFNYIWGEASRKRRDGKHVVVDNPNTAPAEEEFADGFEALPSQQTNEVLVLHSEYRDKIRAHQEEGIRFLQRNLIQDEPNGCILAHAPGTGKSFLIIAFLQSFQSSFPDQRPLIMAPNGMLSVWVREFQKWKVEDMPIFNLYEAPSVQEQDDDDNRALHQLRQGQYKMLQQWEAQKSVLLVGYPTFSRLISGNDASSFPGIKRLLLNVPGLLILDEGHFPRNKDTQILKSLSQVQTRRRVLLSGTLFQNNFYELYNLYHLVRPDFMTLNASCTKSLLEDFMKTNSSPAKMKLSQSPKLPKQRSRREDMELRLFENLGETIKAGEPEKKRQAISQLRRLSEPFVHWYKGQVLEELPGLIDLTLFMKMTPIQEELLTSLQAKVENQLDRAIKSSKVCVHPSLVNMGSDGTHNNDLSWKDTDIDPKKSSKIMFVLDLLQLAAPLQEKVLLFSQLLDPFSLLEKLLNKLWGWRFNREILKIEGQTSLEERENVIDRFNQDPKSRILFASIKTCGEGVSLIGASRIVLLDVHWNPMVSRQAISRAFRIGQKRKVFVYRLVGQGATEEYAHMKASEKEWLAKQIFEGSRDQDYTSYCYEVDPQEVDTYFESQYLRENVVKCFRYHFV